MKSEQIERLLKDRETIKYKIRIRDLEQELQEEISAGNEHSKVERELESLEEEKSQLQSSYNILLAEQNSHSLQQQKRLRNERLISEHQMKRIVSMQEKINERMKEHDMAFEGSQFVTSSGSNLDGEISKLEKMLDAYFSAQCFENQEIGRDQSGSEKNVAEMHRQAPVIEHNQTGGSRASGERSGWNGATREKTNSSVLSSHEEKRAVLNEVAANWECDSLATDVLVDALVEIIANQSEEIDSYCENLTQSNELLDGLIGQQEKSVEVDISLLQLMVQECGPLVPKLNEQVSYAQVEAILQSLAGTNCPRLVQHWNRYLESLIKGIVLSQSNVSVSRKREELDLYPTDQNDSIAEVWIMVLLYICLLNGERRVSNNKEHYLIDGQTVLTVEMGG